MKIVRDGKEIELTISEIREACYEYDKLGRIKDLAEELELYVDEQDEERYKLAEKIEPLFDKYIGLNNEYWECYWSIARMAIENYLKEHV